MTCMDCVSFNVCYKHNFYGRPATLVCCEFKNKADFVEVKCRCGECKSYHYGICDHYIMAHEKADEADFCSYGERRDT